MRLKPIERYIIAIFALAPLAAVAQSSHAAAKRAKYVPAEVIKKYAPSYPEREALSRREGWVLLSYIVSTNGRVKDVMIEDSTGNKDFEREAVRTAETWRYKPAMLNGKPVEQSMTRTRMTFVMGDSPKGARPSFFSSFVHAQKAIHAGKLGSAEKMLDGPELTDRENLYEDAWFWWLKYEYLIAAGHSTPDQLMDCLHKAVSYQEGDLSEPKSVPKSRKVDYNYLPRNVFVAAAAHLFVLQAQTLDLSGAMRTFNMLSRSAFARGADRVYPTVMKQLKPVYAKIKSLVGSDRVLDMNGHIGEHNDWVHQLVRRSFSLGKINGHLAALEVRCKRGTEIFSATDSETFTIPESWGECSVYLKGDAGTTFTLYQYPKKSK